MKLEHVSISKGNSKMGYIKSVSLPPFKTCTKCGCWSKCYAYYHGYVLYENTRNAYDRNLRIWESDPDRYFREIDAAIVTQAFFRFHVGGDIPNADYLDRMCKVMRKNKHCKALCFTKKYSLVNDYIKAGHKIPSNLQIIFSGWVGLKMDNPYNLPEAHVMYKDNTTTASDGAMLCKNNCTECLASGKNCWKLKKGQQVMFLQH